MQWTNDRRKVGELRDHPDNPRIFTEKGLEDLRKSIESVGYCEPVAINTDGTILSGHARKRVLIGAGMEEVDVRVPERWLTPEEQREVLVRLNKNVAGIWNTETLANIFEVSDLAEWGFEDSDLGLGGEGEKESKERRAWAFLVTEEERATIREALNRATGEVSDSHLGAVLCYICQQYGG